MISQPNQSPEASPKTKSITITFVFPSFKALVFSHKAEHRWAASKALAMRTANASSLGLIGVTFLLNNPMAYRLMTSWFKSVSHFWIKKPWGLLSERETLRTKPLVTSFRCTVEVDLTSCWVE